MCESLGKPNTHVSFLDFCVNLVGTAGPVDASQQLQTLPKV